MAWASACAPARRSATSTRRCRREVFSQNATVAGLQTRQTALQAIDAVQGTPGQGTDIASLLGNLQDQFSTLLNDPDNQPQQSQVVSAATTLAQGINALSDAYTTQRQTAQDNIVTEVGDAEHDARHHRRAQQPDRRAEGERPEHRRPREPARRRGGGRVATGRREGAGAAERRPAGHHHRRPVAADPRHDQSAQHQRRERAAGRLYPGGGIPPIMLGGIDVTAAASGRPDRRQHHAARHHAADRPGGTRRVRAEPGEPLRARRA